MNAYKFKVDGGSPGNGRIVVVAATEADATAAAESALRVHSKMDWREDTDYTLRHLIAIVHIQPSATVVYLDDGER